MMSLRKIVSWVLPYHNHVRRLETELIRSCQPFQNCCVNLGCGTNPIRHAINIDIERKVKPDIVADMSCLPLQPNAVDTIVSNSVLEHVLTVNRAIEELARIAKVGCVIILTLPTDVDGPYIRKITQVVFKVYNNYSLQRWMALLLQNQITVKNICRYQSYPIHWLYVVSCVFLPLILVSWLFLYLLKKVSSDGIHIFLECVKIG